MRRWFCLSALVFAACGGGLLDEAKREFDAGQYAEAKATIQRIDESEYKTADAQRRTTYALYRGLIFGALGDRTEALAWLGLAKQTEEEFPGSLSADDKARLKLAEERYGGLPNTSNPPPEN